MNTDKIYAVSIANEYAAKDARKVIQLKKLDKKAKTPANVFTYSFGIIAALVVGVGMCLSMKVIGDGSTAMTVLGIAVCVLGFVLAGINRGLFRLDKTYEKMFDLFFIPILDKFGIPEKQMLFTLAFYINGLMAIISEWLKQDCSVPTAEIAEIMQNCIKTIDGK